jgi:hypothetical protein
MVHWCNGRCDSLSWCSPGFESACSEFFLCVMKWMTPRSHVAVQHGHLPFIFPFSTSWLTSHLVCEIYQILLDIHMAYSWNLNIQVQVSDWIEYSRYMISIWQYKLDIYQLVLYIWHMPDIRHLQNIGGHHVTPYVLNIYYIYLHQVSMCHIYGVTWLGLPPIFRWSRISGICQIYRTSGYM